MTSTHGKSGRLLVVDIETTCWEGDPPHGEVSDIIEVGVCFLNASSLECSESRSILVKPSRSRVSDFCTRLTTITPSDVESGSTLSQACSVLTNEFQSRSRPWASYGDFDRRRFQSDCRELDVPYPFGHSHLNVKNLVALALGIPEEVSLTEALALFDLPATGTLHRAADDAWNVAQLVTTIVARARAGSAGA